MSKRNNQIQKQLKRVNPVVLIFWLILVCGFGVGGFFTCNILTKDDCFTLIGQKETTIAVGETYTYQDEGVKVVSFGKNLQDKVKIKTNIANVQEDKYTLDTSEPGEYYIIYTVNSIKYGKIQRVRIFVVEEEE